MDGEEMKNCLFWSKTTNSTVYYFFKISKQKKSCKTGELSIRECTKKECEYPQHLLERSDLGNGLGQGKSDTKSFFAHGAFLFYTRRGFLSPVLKGKEKVSFEELALFANFLLAFSFFRLSL